jgi:hypothetical protein
MSRVGVDQDDQIVGKTRVLNTGVFAAPVLLVATP